MTKSKIPLFSASARVNVLHGKLEAWHMRNEPLDGYHDKTACFNTICFGPVPGTRLVVWDADHKVIRQIVDKLNRGKL